MTFPFQAHPHPVPCPPARMPGRTPAGDTALPGVRAVGEAAP
ncbi:hypothetical protein ABZW11_25575 [Nonomuraea sp. NPDC004580]